MYLIYALGSQSIDEKLQLFQNRLQLFGTALSNLEKIILSADINKNDQSQFRDHSQLLDHFREQVLPICNSSPVYMFHIDFQSDNDGTADFIAQILQLPSINRCRAVYFQYKNETFIQLPVEVISNWLNRNSDDGIGGIEHGKKRLFLAMNNRIKIQNAAEICDHLKMVMALFTYSNQMCLKFSEELKIKNF